MAKFTPADWDDVPAYLDRLAGLNERFMASVGRATALFGRISEELPTTAWQHALRGECAVWRSLQEELSTSPVPEPAQEVRTRLLRVYELVAQAAGDAEAFLDDRRWRGPGNHLYDDERLDAALAKIDVAVGLMNDVDRSTRRLVDKVGRKRVGPKRPKKRDR